jgi:hypothetical protein
MRWETDESQYRSVTHQPNGTNRFLPQKKEQDMNTAIQINEEITARQQEAFMGKMLEALNGFFDIHTIYMGNRLGLYKPLAGPTALTSKELAVRKGNDERYVREWLEAQTVSGILEVDDAEAPSRERRFRLPAGHTEVLCDQESAYYLAPVTRMAVGAALPLEAIVSAFRTGEGVSFSNYGAGMRQGVGELNRPLFMKQLGDEYLPSIPGYSPSVISRPGCSSGRCRMRHRLVLHRYGQILPQDPRGRFRPRPGIH